MKKGVIYAGALFMPFLLLVSVASAQNSTLIPCGNNVDAFGKVTDPCTFQHIITLARNVIDFLMFRIAAPLSALLFAYAGFLMFTNNGNEGKVSQARGIFWNVLIGLIIALAAYTLVTFILNFFDVDTANNGTSVPMRLI